MAPFRLDGRVVALTGGARGIGAATATALVDAGAQVAIGDLDEAAAHELAATLGTLALGVGLDVTDRDSFEAFLDAAETHLGPLDVLVNNAGVLHAGDLVDEDDAWTRRMLDVNLYGVLCGMKLALPRMLSRGTGHIVNLASTAAKFGVAGIATYSATKHGVYGASEALAAELRGTGVRVSVVLPTLVRTELATGAHSGLVRTLEPEEVAAGVLRVLRTRQFELVLPGTVAALLVATRPLPAAPRAALARRLGTHEAYRGIPQEQRADYEGRVERDQPR